MAYNQLLDFIDSIDTTVHRHIVMFYEEPEYAKLVQMRFLDDGLRRGECCIYFVQDEQDRLFTHMEMTGYGIDVDSYARKGLLQLYNKKNIQDLESFKHALGRIKKDTAEKFFNYHRQSSQMLPPIRGVDLSISHASPDGDSGPQRVAATVELQIERFFHNEALLSFNGAWMCPYHLDNIDAQMDKKWMEDVLNHHDAVLFLPKLSNGIALDLRDANKL
jgi:hypothetical protein